MKVKDIILEVSRQDQIYYDMIYRGIKNADQSQDEYVDPNKHLYNQNAPDSVLKAASELGIQSISKSGIIPKDKEESVKVDQLIDIIKQSANSSKKDLDVGVTAVKYQLNDGTVWVKYNNPSFFNTVLWQPAKPYDPYNVRR